jgi:chloramphenicol-sensitive protein RarD
MNDTAPAAPPAALSTRTDPRGLAAAATAFFIWGLLPLYLKALQAVPVLQVTAHRLVWGCVFAFIWLYLRRELGNVWTALRDPATRWRLCASATLISINWITYVYGIAANRVVETSLGYFINPLVNVLLGVLLLSERLNAIQWTAVTIAGAGVAWLTWSAGHPPWISLILAFSFGMYGLVRKVIRVDALPGFASETLLLAPLGIGYVIWCEMAGSGVMTGGSVGLYMLLIVGGPLTAIPLVLFAFGARRIPYSTIGLLQYIGPTIQMLLAVFVFGEPFSGPRVLGFVLIWSALALYAGDGLWRSRRAMS